MVTDSDKMRKMGIKYLNDTIEELWVTSLQLGSYLAKIIFYIKSSVS